MPSTGSHSRCTAPTSRRFAGSSTRISSRSPSTASACSSARWAATPKSRPAGASITERSDATDARLRVTRAGESRAARGGCDVRPQDRRGHEAAASVPAQLRRHLRLDRPAAHRDADDRRAVQLQWARETRRAGRRIFSCRPTTAADEDACATKILSTLARRAYRRPVTKGDTTSLLDVLSRGPSQGEFRHRHPAGAAPAAGQPDVCVPRRRGRPTAKAGHASERERCRAGVATVFLPLEQHAGRCAARFGGAGSASQAGGARA